MYQKIKRNLKQLPPAVGGLALGIASLGSLWESVYNTQGYIQNFTAIIAAGLLISLVFRFLLHPKSLWHDLSHQLTGSIVPTFAMATMVISTALAKISYQSAVLLWVAGLGLHLIFLLAFAYHRIQDLQLKHLLPSWFIPPIGLALSVITCPNMVLYKPVCVAALSFGMINFLILLPTMLNRLIFCEHVQEAAKPSIAVLAAPASLCLTGYLTVIDQPSPIIIAMLLGIAFLMTVVTYLALGHLSRLPFSPGFAAFTFPLVISAKAVYAARDWFQNTGLAGEYIEQLELIAMIELLGATAIVLWVSLGYLSYFARREASEEVCAG